MEARVRACRTRGIPARIYLYGVSGMGSSVTANQFSWKNQGWLGKSIGLLGLDSAGVEITADQLLTSILRELEALDGYEECSAGEKSRRLQWVISTQRPRFTLIVDDYPNPERLANLLPSDAAEVTLIVTGKAENRILDSVGFECFPLTALSLTNAKTLFRARLGPTADRIDAADTHTLTTYCEGHPELLVTVAGSLRGRPQLVPHLIRQVAESAVPHRELDSSGKTDAFIREIYTQLPSDLKNAFVRLGCIPAESFSIVTAAAVLESEEGPTLGRLLSLKGWGAVTDDDESRFGMPLMYRSVAAELASTPGDLYTADDSARIWVRSFLSQALPRSRAISGRWWIPQVSVMLDLSITFHPEYRELCTDRPAGLAWFDSELPNLILAVRTARRVGEFDVAAYLCVVMFKYLHVHGYQEVWLDTHDIGLECARATGNIAAIMQVANQYGAACLARGRYGEAQDLFNESLAAAEQLGDVLGQQSALEWLGKVAAAQGQHRVALGQYRRSQAVLDAAGPDEVDPHQRLRAAATLGLQRMRSYNELDQWHRILAEAPAIVTFFDIHGETDNSAKIRLELGRAQLALTGDAIATFDAAVDFARKDGIGRLTADTRRWRARAHKQAGHPDAAEIDFRVALDYHDPIDQAVAEEIRRELRELRP